MASSYIRSVLSGLRKKEHPEIAEDSQLISAHTLTSRAGTWYEKIRYLVDYQEERSIKRNAIERILKRKLIFEGQTDIGVTLVHELVSGGYVANDSATEKTAERIQNIIGKYLVLIEGVRVYQGEVGKLEKSAVSFAATEIYRFLFPGVLDDLVAEAFYFKVKDQIEYTPAMRNGDAGVQTYIGCRRAFLKESDTELCYALWLRRTPEWKEAGAEDIKKLSKSFGNVISQLRYEIGHPLGLRISSKLKDSGVYFSFVKEIIEKYGVEAERVFDDKEHLERDIKESLSAKYLRSYSQAKRSGIRAVIYILCTKILLAFILEVPFDIWVVGEINYLVLGINVLFHPLLLLSMASSLKPLGAENTARITTGVEIVSSDEPIAPIRIKTSSKGSGWDYFFGLVYGTLFLGSFVLIISILNKFDFNIVSTLLFLLFITLVSYFGLRIRHNAREWKVSGDKDSTAKLFWDLFTFPIVRVGKWLSQKFSTINIFVLFLDFIIETPFKLLLQVLDSFLTFIKEKHDEIM